MTLLGARPVGEDVRADPPRRLRWTTPLPWLVTGVGLTAICRLGGAGVPQVLLYAAALAVFVTLPGAVGWRLLSDSASTWLHVVVLGSLTGLCLQVSVYVLGRVVGFPYLPAVLPVAALAIALSRADRRRLVFSRLDPVPPVLAWAVTAATGFAMTWVAAEGWRHWAYPGADPAQPNGDEPYQVALIAELRHHFPPTTPSVAGAPLSYHWYAHAHLAAMSWLTGLRPDLILDRLSLGGMFWLLFAAVGLVAWRLSRSPAAGAGAVVLLVLVGNFVPFPHGTAISPFDELMVSEWDPLSPSLDFGMAILMLAVWLLLPMLRRAYPIGATADPLEPRPTRVRRGELALLVLTLVSLPGAKATNVPLVGAGLVGAAGFGWWWSRGAPGTRLLRGRVPRPVWWLLAATIAVFAYATLILYHGASEGLWVQPLHITTFGTKLFDLHGTKGTAAYLVMLLASWAVSWLGAGLLFRRADTRRDPRAVFLLSAAIAGTLATLVLAHPHGSEDYFVRFALPLWTIAAAWGWSIALSDLRATDGPRRARWYPVLGVVAGMLTCFLVRSVTPALVPGRRPTPWHVVGPYVWTAVAALVVVAATAVLVRARARRRLRVGVVTLAFALGLGLIRVPDLVVDVAHHPWTAERPPTAATAMIGAGGLEAAAWVRRHSSPNDLVATNAHWQKPTSDTDNRGFWIAAETERRVLVEGWGYTAPVWREAARREVSSFGIGFSDPGLLAMNDAAFTHPSAATLAALTARGVDDLVVDDRYPSDVAGLRKVAVLRFHAGDYWVFTPRVG